MDGFSQDAFIAWKNNPVTIGIMEHFRFLREQEKEDLANGVYVKEDMGSGIMLTQYGTSIGYCNGLEELLNVQYTYLAEKYGWNKEKEENQPENKEYYD